MESSPPALDSFGILVADHVSAMLAYWDTNQVCRFANAAYSDWFGKTREEMLNKMTLKELLGPLYEKNHPYIQGALEGKNQIFEREIKVPSGEIRHSLANYFPHVVDGQVRGFVVLVSDITPIKLLELELVKSNKIVQQQNSRLLNFANIVSHNLKSYANNLGSMLSLFAQAESENEKSIMLNHLKKISAGFSSTVSHLNEVVQVQNLGGLISEPIHLHEYVEKAMNILSSQCISNEAIIHNRVNADLVLQTNPAYIESILLNLLSNAIKYRHPERQPVIEIDTETENDATILRIKDNGMGIDLKKHGKNLFGMYKTFHGNPDAEGIGLFITKHQIEALGAQLNVESEVGKGTTFIIHFPTSATVSAKTA